MSDHEIEKETISESQDFWQEVEEALVEPDQIEPIEEIVAYESEAIY